VVPELYTTVKNVSGSDQNFSFLPPHGVRLAAGATYSFFGGLTDIGGAAGQEAASRSRYHKALQYAIEEGLLDVVQTSQPVFEDATTGEPQVIVVDNGVVDASSPSWVPADSDSDSGSGS
jgi:hypothetical protein